MHVLFYHPPLAVRVEDLSYDRINYSSGVSGTETAMIEFAKYLSDQGHRVTVAGIVKNKNEEHGILYVPSESLSDIDFKSVDVFCPTFYLFDKECIVIYNQLLPSTIIWVMAQCYVSEHEIRQLSKFFKVIVQCVSPWLRSKYPWISDTDTSCCVIENAMNPLFNTPLTCTNDQKKGNWVFHASFERGGDVAIRVFERVRAIMPSAATDMHVAAYYTPHIQEVAAKMETMPYLHSHGSLSKQGLRNLLDKCDYFIYPLVLPQGLVHHDTYGCVVLEAMARGVIVVTWDVACYESVYKDCVVRLETPSYPGYDPTGVKETNHAMLTDAAVDFFAKVVTFLETNPEIKEQYRQKGMQWAKNQLWEHRGKQLEAWLQEHVSEK